METPSNPEPTKPPAHKLVPDPPAPNSLIESAGKFADDPYWDVMMDSIRRHRREMDAAWDDVE
jgi:hypothetical protein